MEFEEIFEKFKPVAVIGLIGLVLLAAGILAVFLTTQDQPQIEILPAEEKTSSATIWIDLRGAVEKPGVYELPANSRINDLLIRAGGLSAEADREWLDKNINLAQKLTDGVKIYLPPRSLGEAGGASQSVAGITDRININSASVAQLDSLWGIGEARAKAIVAGRPYQTIEELITKAKIPKNVFEKIKNEITVY